MNYFSESLRDIIGMPFLMLPRNYLEYINLETYMLREIAQNRLFFPNKEMLEIFHTSGA